MRLIILGVMLLALSLTSCKTLNLPQSVQENRRMRDNLRCLNAVPAEPLGVCMARKGWTP